MSSELTSSSSTSDCSQDDDLKCDSDLEEKLVWQYLTRINEEHKQHETRRKSLKKRKRDSSISSTSDSLLEYHEAIVKENRYFCPYDNCNKSFVAKYKMKIHIDGVHRKLNLFSCPICGESFPNSGRRNRHAEVRHPPAEGFECTDCGRSFTNRYSFVDHSNTYHRDNRRMKCEICGIAGFTRENQVEKHVIMEHTKRSEDGNFLCIYPNCDVSTSSYTNFRTHLRIHKDPEKQFVCNRPNCNERFITWHARSDHEKKVHGRWVCEHCGKEYTIPYHFHKHVKSHTQTHIAETSQFGCPFKGCTKVFSSRGNMLRQHFNTYHLKLLQYRCGKCKELFTTVRSVVQHIKAVHGTDTNKISVDPVYHSSSVQTTGDLRKVFKGYEEGQITNDMFMQNGAGLDLSRQDVRDTLERIVNELTVERVQSKRAELDRGTRNGFRRTANTERQSLELIMTEMAVNQEICDESPFVDSIDSTVAPLETSLSTVTSVHLELHRRPRNSKKPKITSA